MNAKRIREIRTEKGLSQKEMADLLGVSPQTYNYAETGKRKLSLRNCIKFQKVTGIDDAEMWRIYTKQ